MFSSVWLNSMASAVKFNDCSSRGNDCKTRDKLVRFFLKKIFVKVASNADTEAWLRCSNYFDHSSVEADGKKKNIFFF